MKFEFQKDEEPNCSGVQRQIEPDVFLKNKYESLASKLSLIVEEVYSYEIPEDTIENWKKLGIIMYQVDQKPDFFLSGLLGWCLT